MKKSLYVFVLFCLMGAGALRAQPCSKFENPSPQGSWVNVNSGVGFANTNLLDGSQCATLYDQSGGSYFENSVDFRWLGEQFRGQCLCFDYYVKNDGYPSSSVAIKPTIYVSMGSQYIYFEATASITEGSPWVHVCAPIELATGATLPGNADGQWKMPAGYTINDFNNILISSQKIFFIVDVAGSSYQTEEISVDNVCVEQCSSGPLPCSTFNDQLPGNWTPILSVLSYGTNLLDSSPCATLDDAAGGSFFSNGTDYNNLATNYLHKCLCFDYNVSDDGLSGSVAINPRIYLGLGSQYIWFEAYTTVTEGTQWVHVCAPIELSSGGSLPSNADGQWMMPTGYTLADFDNIISNCDQVFFIVDVAGSSAIAETISVDNICVVECSTPIRCNSGFRLETSTNTDPLAYPIPPSYMANVFLNFNNPGSTYTVDWGDGSPVTSPFVSHIYPGPGSYIVCVTEYQNEVAVCKTCMSFCFGQAYSVYLPGNGSDDGGQPDGKSQGTSTGLLGLPENFHEGAFEVYPNPSKDHVELKLNLTKKARVSIKVVDLLGKIVAEIPEKGYDAGVQNVKILTENLPSGVYNIQINVSGQQSSIKLSVIK